MGLDPLPWITVGAQVVTYSLTAGVFDAHVTTIKRVNKVTFAVEGSHRRFKRSDGYSQETGWNAGGKAVPADSDEAVRVLALARRHRLRRGAVDAFEKWKADPTRENRLVAITTLNIVPDEV